MSIMHTCQIIVNYVTYNREIGGSFTLQGLKILFRCTDPEKSTDGINGNTLTFKKSILMTS